MNLIRYYHQNRKKIWRIIIIIFSAFILLQLINTIYSKNLQKKAINPDNRQEIETNNTDITHLTTNQSVVTGQKVANEELESATTTINKFITYCNQKELQKAYDLLTEECKTQTYHTLEIFEQAYYSDIFNGESKNCSIENWINNTYKVEIKEDILVTGKNNNYAKQDYITVKKEKDEYKLNINSYIGKTELNETTQKDNIRMEVLNKNTYMEYEEYTIKVTNDTEHLMLLDGRTNVKTLYLQDSKGNRYDSYTQQLTEPMLTISAGETKEVTIRFYSAYQSTKRIEYVVFSDIILYNGEFSEIRELKARV